MKRFIFVFCLMAGLNVSAQFINLACEGRTNFTTEHTKFPELNQKNKPGWAMFNIAIDLSSSSLTVGDSYYTANLTYPNLEVTESSYKINNFWKNPNPDYDYFDMLLFINRYTGEFKMTNGSKTKYIKHNSTIFSKTEINGTCKIGVVWQQKF